VIILKFSDIITTVASLKLIAILIMYPLTLVLTPAFGNFEGFMLSAVIAFILSAIIVGYIFTQKIWEENRTKTILKISILFTVLVTILVLIENAASGDWTPMIRENYLNTKPTATPSTTEWYYIERLAIIQDDFLNVVLILAITFIGLYVGSTLKKPTKT